jgi:hypothetical protein
MLARLDKIVTAVGSNDDIIVNTDLLYAMLRMIKIYTETM